MSRSYSAPARTVGEVIRALSRMAQGAEEKGHYSFERLDAGWANEAIELLIENRNEIRELRKALAICRNSLGAIPATPAWYDAKSATDILDLNYSEIQQFAKETGNE